MIDSIFLLKNRFNVIWSILLALVNTLRLSKHMAKDVLMNA